MSIFSKRMDAEAKDTGGTPQPEREKEAEKVTFTAEQQEKINELINKAFAKGAEKAAEQKRRESLTEAQKLEEERAALQRDRAALKAENLIVREGLTLPAGQAGAGEVHAALVDMLAVGDDRALELRVKAIRTLVETLTKKEVDKRLGEAKSGVKQGETREAGIGAMIRAQLQNK